APEMREEDYRVFDTSFEEAFGGRYLSPLAHLLMMAATQPFISGELSKTVNLPEGVPVAAIEHLHMEAWRLGTKSVAIYRNNSKQTQPMSATEGAVVAGPPPTVRYKLPRQVDSKRIKVGVQDLELY